jgi:VCBS repeat-containing protein
VTLTGSQVTGSNALATDPLTGSTYTVLKVTGVTGRLLARLTVATGVATSIGNIGDNFAGLTFDQQGGLYGVTGDGASVPETLYRFQRASVIATEDSGTVQFTGLLANDSDPDGQTIDTVPSGPLTSPSGATYEILAGGNVIYNASTSLTLNSLGQDATFDDVLTYTVQDSAGEQATGTITVTVAGKNDAPSLDLDGSGGTTDFTASPIIVGTPAQPTLLVDTDAEILDPDTPATIASLTATLFGALDAEALSATPSGDANTINFSGNVLTVTASAGFAPLSDFQAVLRTLTYQNSSITPTIGKRTIEIVVDDGIVRSNTATARIGVTTAPTLTLPDSPVEAFAADVQGVAVTFNVSASDAEDGPIPAVAVPPSGSVFQIGDTTVNVTATDSDGATISGSFIVRVRLANPVHSLLIEKGDAVPNASNSSDIPSDAVIASLGTPAIDDSGQISYVARWSSRTEGKGSGVILDDASVAAAGGTVPGIAGARFKSFTDPVGSDGKVAFVATLSGVAKSSASAVLSNAGGALSAVAQSGTEAPGAGGATWRSFQSVALENGTIAFLGQLTPGTGTPKVTPKNDSGIWIAAAGAIPTLVLREGDSVAGSTIKALVSFRPGAGSPGQGRGWLTTPTGGPRALALAMLADRSHAILSAAPGAAPVILSQTGAAGAGGPDIAGASFSSFGLPAANVLGNQTVAASLTVGAGGVTADNARGIFADLGSATYVPIARTAGTGPDVFRSFSDPVLADDGSLGFAATIAGASKRSSTPAVLWLPPSESDLLFAARAATEPPGIPGAQWKSFPSIAIAAGRGPLFLATLQPGKGGVSAKTAGGLWAVDYNREPRLIFQRGVTQIGGKTVKSFKLLSASVGNTGVTRSFNDRQQIAWLATFSDKSSGIVISQVP